jgi:mono/diheme cytochrome c family protein
MGPFTVEHKAALFVERGCAVCHGPQAEGTRNGPALRGPGKSFTLVTRSNCLALAVDITADSATEEQC